MKNFFLIPCGLFIAGISMYSQDPPDNPSHKWMSYIHLESGFIFPGGTIKENISIRQNISTYYVDQTSNGRISSATPGFIAGLRWEYFSPRLKAGISTGLRYTGYGSEITGYTSSKADFFYLRYSMVDSDTKFARVKSLSETKKFISIPLELRFIPVQLKGFGLFAKGGIEVSLLNFGNGTSIDFQDSGMDINRDVVLNNIKNSTEKLYSTLYGSVGMKLGREDRPNYSFEIFLPSVLLTKNNFNLTDIGYFQGFKFSVQIPVKK